MIFVARQHRLCIAIVGSGLLFATSVPAQQYDQAQEIVASANQLFAAGNYDEARALLVDRANECTNDEGAEDCLLLMYYSLGYLEQRLSDKDANLSDMHLDRAHGYYQEVLDHRHDANTWNWNNRTDYFYWKIWLVDSVGPQIDLYRVPWYKK